MSAPPQSMAPLPQYASSPAAALAPATAAPASVTAAAAPAAVASGDWRDKDADRSARQQIARIILTLIMKSANRPASVNYNPREIARRLEHTLYMSAQRSGFQGIPFSTAVGSQPLQMPMAVSQMAVSNPSVVAMSSAGPTSVSATCAAIAQSGGSSILDELEREADEMANGVSDEPIAMPESEMQGAAGGSSFAAMAGPASQFNPVALSMPPEISAGLPASATAASVATSSGGPASMTPMTEASIAQKREELKRRLIQLKHARTCTTGECSIEYCSRTKALLAHVSRCAHPHCVTIGCKSTRQLLSHFRKCRNLQCDVCSAIRPPMNETEQQLVLRRQQERLCMLRHASTCAAPQCILPYCAGMKVLWKHICECHQRQCRTDHCISSRYVLSHFKQCNKMICEVCGPVRKAIKIVDSCRGNPAQLQMAANQCPEGVRGLIKIMNTTVAPGMGNALNSAATPASLQPPGAAGQGGAAALQQRNSLTPGDAWSTQQSCGVKNESKASASDAAGPVTASNSSALVSGSGSLPNGANSVKSEAKDGAGAELAELKKKPLKFQTEKEKKLRRKEQAKIMKARAQAKAQAATSGGVLLPATPAGSTKQAAAPAAALVVSNGLVVRGSQAHVRADHTSHQDISYLDSMTEAQLDEHIRSLRFNFCGHITLTELKDRLMPLLTKLMDSEYGWTFNNPVDPVQWNIPDYFEIIKCPMDLGTIKKRLENEHYNSVEAFAGDVRLVFENCIAYNSSTNKFNIAAKQLLASFDKALAALKNQLEKQLFKRCEQRREEMCQLCGGDSFKFAPCMLFCSGPCAGRIRRHTHYYSDPRGEHHWCSSCYKQMKDGPIDMATLPQLSAAAPAEGGGGGGGGGAAVASVAFDGVLKKSSLLKRKNSEVAEEPWVECDSCKLWYHQICALFNERNHAISGEQEPFVCPICVKKQRVAGVKPSTENGLKARRLPITRMARLIETRVMESIEQAGKDEAERLGNLGNADSIGFSRGVEETESETKFGVTIREVLSIDKQVQIKPKLGKLLAAKYGKPKKPETKAANGVGGGPTKSLKRQRADSATKKRQNGAAPSAAAGVSVQSLQLTYRSRCICVFQELDGVDVLIFTLYVQEYGPDSLDPNAGRVYVSYLDSVNYFQPKKLRTLMHQQVMLGFLEDCKNRGFHTCHIWSCPPLKGDDYIFFCKPENQKIPKSARLRQWYQKLLQQAKKDGLVYNVSNLYAEYYMKKKAAHELPYFEGDYWPRLAEDLIKQLEEKTPGGGGGGSARTDTADGADGGAEDAGEADGTSTPLSRSPSPSETSVLEETGAADEAGAAPTSLGKSSLKTGVGAKSKKKRSKKATPDAPATSTRSSMTKTRSKKSGPLGRPSGGSKNVVNSDPLMQKLKGILEPQKDDFFVVDLHPKCHKCAAPIVHVGCWELKTLAPPRAVTELVDAVKKVRASSTGTRNAPPRHYHHFFCAACYAANRSQLEHRVEVAAAGAKRAEELSARILSLSEKAAAPELAELDLQEVKFAAALTFVYPTGGESVKTEPVGVDPARASDVEKAASDDVKMKVEEGEDESAGATASAEAKPPVDIVKAGGGTSAPPTTTAVTLATAARGGAADDLDDVLMPCEIFDTREAFLMYCQNNHCQFDQIRRAKHSSMMVLYHLFNQGTTGFVFSCTGCKVALTSGNRWNCSICPVFNLCDKCNAKTKHEHQLHLFKREAGSAELKRAKVDKSSVGATPGALKHAKAAGPSRKRKLNQASPVKAVVASAGAAVGASKTVPASAAQKPAVAPVGGDATGDPTGQGAAVAVSAVGGDGSATAAADAAGGEEDPAKKQRRIHNIDPQLLLQLEHASSCTVADCAFFNCQRMRSMLKHGATCEQRLAGPCVLCKRIVGLLSAHARQCEKDYAACQVPRCADIRRHFLQQLQQRQEQFERARHAPQGTPAAAPPTDSGGGAPAAVPAPAAPSQHALEPTAEAPATAEDAAMVAP
ncbi:hypothetical protein PybrP1_011635 [[Pythium] brassicae (nom. inval.)]|nr:hypothetical protein PybrP1_011635 [[Pythium] brassicae (nom. inval.)]